MVLIPGAGTDVEGPAAGLADNGDPTDFGRTDHWPAMTTIAPGESLPNSAWVDAMGMADPAWDTVSGDWRRGPDSQGADLTTGVEIYSRILLPVELQGGYDLKADFTRVSGDGFAAIIFPVGPRTCMLELGAWSLHGMERIDGKHLGDPLNPTARRPGLLSNGRRYSVALAVRIDGNAAKIEAVLDGQPLTSWGGKLSSLDVLDCWSLPQSRRPALAAYNSTVTFHGAAVRAVSGKSRMSPSHVSPKVDLADRRWIELLGGLDLERATIHGQWLKDGDGIAVARASQNERCVRVMLPHPVEGNYDLVVEFTRTAGNDSVMVTLPVGTRLCTLHFSASVGRMGGLECIDGRDIIDRNNPTLRRPNQLINDRRYQTFVQVRTAGDNATVEAWPDGRPFTSWAGKQSSLSTCSLWTQPDHRCVGIGASKTGVTFHTVRVRPLGAGAAPAATALVRETDQRVDLGGGVELEMVLIPAGEFLTDRPIRTRMLLPTRSRITSPTRTGGKAGPLYMRDCWRCIRSVSICRWRVSSVS